MKQWKMKEEHSEDERNTRHDLKRKDERET